MNLTREIEALQILRAMFRNYQAIRATTNAAGSYTWTFPVPYASGVIPVVEVTVEDSTAGVLVNHKVTVTNTAVTVKVDRSSAVTVLGISVLGVSAAAAVVVHITAQEPT